MAYEVNGKYEDGSYRLGSFPGSMNTNIVLSLVGTCPMLHPEDFNINQDNKDTNMKYGLTVSYESPSSMMLIGKVKYNMKKMFEKISTASTSGGFFFTRSDSNTEQRSFFRDSFTVEWTEQDPKNSIPDDQRQKMEMDMRNHVLSRLAQLALPDVPNQVEFAKSAGIPVSGSLVIADSLMSACPGSGYCVAGSVLLRGLNAIFGRGASSSRFKSIQDVDIVETWSFDKVVMKPWVTSYVHDVKIKNNRGE